jgi:hypothetical protein
LPVDGKCGAAERRGEQKPFQLFLPLLFAAGLAASCGQ